MTSHHLETEVFAAFLDRTRWFGGKGRPYAVTDVRTLGELPGGPPVVVIHLVEVTYSDEEGGTELYQVPLSFYVQPENRLDHAFVGWWEDSDHGWQHAYDALHDREAMALWQRAFDAATETGGLRFHRLPGHELDLEAHSTLFSGEQSNSSVAFGEDALMKVFRKVTPGVNPDIEVHEVLTRAGSEHVAALYGWLDVDDGGRTLQLAMLQQFLRTASDGWDLALASVRSLFADPEMHAQRLRRRLRRRVDPARRGAARGPRGPARPLPVRDPPGGRRGRARRDHDRTARGRAGRRTRAGGARRQRCGRRSTPSPSSTASTSSGSTATCTSARPCARHTAGRSSTSRASRPSRWPSGCCRTRRGATWPGCCAASTTPPAWSSGRSSTSDETDAELIDTRAAGVVRAQQEPLPASPTPAAS